MSTICVMVIYFWTTDDEYYIKPVLFTLSIKIIYYKKTLYIIC